MARHNILINLPDRMVYSTDGYTIGVITDVLIARDHRTGTPENQRAAELVLTITFDPPIDINCIVDVAKGETDRFEDMEI